MIRLIVNADDLGSSPQRDRGIFSAFTEGIVTSASLLANGSNFVAAVAQAQACTMPVGVHLNLAEGPALTGPIPGLTDAAGNFPGKTGLRSLLLDGCPNETGIREELLAQIARVRTAGLEPDHLDTHQHSVITSYSIHYTKLYESSPRRPPPPRPRDGPAPTRSFRQSRGSPDLAG